MYWWAEHRKTLIKAGDTNRRFFKDNILFGSIKKLIKLYEPFIDKHQPKTIDWEHRKFIEIAARAYEELPDTKDELSRRNSERGKALDQGLDPENRYVWRMEDLVANDIRVMLHVLRKAERRMTQVDEYSAKGEKNWEIAARDKLIGELAQTYEDCTSVKPRMSGNISKIVSEDSGASGPIVDLVRAVWREHDLPKIHANVGNVVKSVLYPRNRKNT